MSKIGPVNFARFFEQFFHRTPPSDCFLLFKPSTFSRCFNAGIKMTSLEIVLLTLWPTLKIFWSVDVTLEATIPNKFPKYKQFLCLFLCISVFALF